jgi:hypothetical protein
MATRPPGTRPPSVAVGVLLLLALVATAPLAGCAPYQPRPAAEVGFLQRAQSRRADGITVTVAVPTDAQGAALFGVSLAAVGIQPVWLDIENATPHAYSFAPIALDSGYFTPREAANRSRFWLRPWDNERMREHFSRVAIGSYLPPGQRLAGFVYTNHERGLKVVNVELVGRGQLRQFFFLAEVPGLRTHFQQIDWSRLYRPDQVREVDEAGLRASLAALPCCGATRDGRGLEDPLNFALVGQLHEMLGTFARAGWHATSVLDAASAWRTFLSYFFGRPYKAAPISPIWLFDRRQDVSLQKARETARERNHLRVWLAPLRHEGRLVWIGQISRDIGLLYTPPLGVTHQVDPDVDEARDYLVQDLLRAQGVARLGWVRGVGAAPPSRPRLMADGTAFFTDGLRAVMILSTEALGLDEIQFLDWEAPPGADPAGLLGDAAPAPRDPLLRAAPGRGTLPASTAGTDVTSRCRAPAREAERRPDATAGGAIARPEPRGGRRCAAPPVTAERASGATPRPPGSASTRSASGAAGSRPSRSPGRPSAGSRGGRRRRAGRSTRSAPSRPDRRRSAPPR